MVKVFEPHKTSATYHTLLQPFTATLELTTLAIGIAHTGYETSTVNAMAEKCAHSSRLVYGSAAVELNLYSSQNSLDLGRASRS
jgi:hypothetical protein